MARSIGSQLYQTERAFIEAVEASRRPPHRPTPSTMVRPVPSARPPERPRELLRAPLGAGLRLVGKAIKVTTVVDPEGLRGLHVPHGEPRIDIVVTVDGQVVKASLNSKSVRRAVAAVATDSTVVVVLQGTLRAGGRLEEAGISAQPRAVKSANGSPLPQDETKRRAPALRRGLIQSFDL
jgi:hypothetical protein